MRPINPELSAVYRATCYRVWLTASRCVDLRIGRAAPALARWLAAADGGRGARRWLILTASNPASVPLCEAENFARRRVLQSQLAAANHSFLPAENRDPNGQWPTEVGFLVVNIGLHEGVALAAQWGQNAVVFGGQDGRGRLVWLP